MDSGTATIIVGLGALTTPVVSFIIKKRKERANRKILESPASELWNESKDIRVFLRNELDKVTQDFYLYKNDAEKRISELTSANESLKAEVFSLKQDILFLKEKYMPSPPVQTTPPKE